MPNNKLDDLNNILFEQLERLNDEDLTDEELEKEIKRSHLITKTAKVIINNATLALNAKKYLDTYGTERSAVPEMLQLKNNK